jgi:hypothetical protein
MMYAKALGVARQSGDPERIAKAEKAHDDYVKLCLEADEMRLGCTTGELSDIMSGRTRSARNV